MTPGEGFSKISQIREALARAEFDSAHVAPFLIDGGMPSPGTTAFGRLLHLTAGGSSLESLIRFFILGLPLETKRVGVILAPVTAADLASLGLAQIEGSLARPLVAMSPYQQWIVAFDHPGAVKSGAPADLVMNITGSTLAVSHFAVNRRSRSTLDLGTGNGLLAIQATTWSDRVTATDLNPRAMQLAAFNARLNGLADIRFLTGDSFAPVESEMFDHILCNPPFAITPRRQYLYRDGGQPQDDFARSLVQRAARHLNEGGIFQMVCDWIHPVKGDWQARLHSWFDGSGCDVWILKDPACGIEDYAQEWIADTEPAVVESVEQRFAQWIAYYQQYGIEAISTGLIAMRHRTTGVPNWFRLDDAPPGRIRNYGDQVLLGFALEDFLQANPTDDELIRHTLRGSPNLACEQICDWIPGRWQITDCTIRLTRGLCYQAKADQTLISFLCRCDGRHTLLEVLQELSQSAGADLNDVKSRLAPVIRDLIRKGFLLPQ